MRHPDKALTPLLHGQLGYVAFGQDDYPTALREFSMAFDQLDPSQPKASMLYLMGVCQQRIGRFDDADRTFLSVRQNYPGTDSAKEAEAHYGARGFYVLVGVFAQPADADKAAAAVRQAGSIPLTSVNKGLTVIRTREMQSYAQAMQVRSSLAGQYPDAKVSP
jgi:tetratricopeptide (TPR) repeat protein